MDLPRPSTDGRVTLRPAELGDPAAFLRYRRRSECQAYEDDWWRAHAAAEMRWLASHA